MNQPARRPDDPGNKPAEPLPVDDPSIPVLTERLTLPPLDLDLEFRLPQRPVTPVIDPQPVAPDLELPPDITLEAPLRIEPAPLAEPVAPEPEPVTAMPLEAQVEPTDIAPRVPTSLLVSNIDALLATPPTATPNEPDEFDVTQSDGLRSNRMETELREMILLDIARRLPTDVESIVRRHLDNAIEDAVRRFTAEVRIALAGSLREMVDRAVKAELDRLKTSR